MSKQSDAKASQGYVAKFVPNTCSKCEHFEFDHVQTHPPTSYQPEGWFADKNMRCGIGGFKVMKTGACAKFEGKVPS